MALRAEEILRIKWELGVSVTLLGSEPYITYLAVFDRAIQPFIIDPTTTSSTVVSADQTQSIALAAVPVIAGSSTPAFTVGTSVTVDVGPNAEVVQIQVLSGTTAWATFANAHGAQGAYPVAMAGGEQVVRSVLARLAVIDQQLGGDAPLAAGVEQMDKGEIRLYGSSTSGSRRGTRDMFDSLIKQREQARDDLGEAVGFPNLRSVRKGAGNRVELY